MPPSPKSKTQGRLWVEWVNHGLKPSTWSRNRLAQIGLLVGIALAVAMLYLLQSSELVTATRRVQGLRADLAQLQRDNAQLSLEISRLGALEQVKQRARQLGFTEPEEVIYISVPRTPVDDAPTIQGILSPLQPVR